VNGSFLIILLLLALAWFVLVRPQRRRQAQQEELFASLHTGDEIVTAGGLYGRIQSLRDDELDLEIAPGTVVRVARRAVAGKIEPEEDEEPDEEADDEPAEGAIPENES
jgi:preprotein translocase subunit YajC